MILVADSGSTKTDWRIIDHNKKVYRKQTIGLNPYIVSEGKVEKEVRANLLKNIAPEWITDIFFYGAGCSTPDKKNFIYKELIKVFPNSNVLVEHDMLGAARALCGNKPGLAGILGTGSNICFYDGNNITKTIVSRGWILGDEGSGNHLGRLLIKDYIADRLPGDLKSKLEAEYELNKEIVLDQVYKKPFPNRYLAGFSKFIKDNEDFEYCQNVVNEAFNHFFTEQVSLVNAGEKQTLNLVGSVAYYFKEILENVAAMYNVSIGIIDKKPIDNLVKFHM
jgi:glucosamine kinase